jgi:hypothetical protein
LKHALHEAERERNLVIAQLRHLDKVGIHKSTVTPAVSTVSASKRSKSKVAEEVTDEVSGSGGGSGGSGGGGGGGDDDDDEVITYQGGGSRRADSVATKPSAKPSHTVSAPEKGHLFKDPAPMPSTQRPSSNMPSSNPSSSKKAPSSSSSSSASNANSFRNKIEGLSAMTRRLMNSDSDSD